MNVVERKSGGGISGGGGLSSGYVKYLCTSTTSSAIAYVMYLFSLCRITSGPLAGLIGRYWFMLSTVFQFCFVQYNIFFAVRLWHLK